MADTNHAIKLYKNSATDKRVGINVTDSTTSLSYNLYVNGTANISGALSANALTLATALSVASGGTGATTALNANYNLGSIYWAGVGTQLASGTNIDTELTLGRTYYSPDKNYTNTLEGTLPTTTSGFKIAYFTTYGATYNKQFAWGPNVTPYLRTKTGSTSTWGEWRTIAHIKANTTTGSATTPVYVTAGGALTPITGAIPISLGGTGATTAANARTNLGITPANIGAAPVSHTHPVSQITWAAGGKLALTAPTANGAEYSIDMPNTTYTGSYWHVWSGKLQKSIAAFYNDDASTLFGGKIGVNGAEISSTYAINCNGHIYSNGAVNCAKNLWAGLNNATGEIDCGAMSGNSQIYFYCFPDAKGIYSRNSDKTYKSIIEYLDNATPHFYGIADGLSTVLDITTGGTGANSAAGARTNLQLYPELLASGYVLSTGSYLKLPRYGLYIIVTMPTASSSYTSISLPDVTIPTYDVSYEVADNSGWSSFYIKKDDSYVYFKANAGYNGAKFIYGMMPY